VRTVIQARDLLRELVARDMKLRYKRSLLGLAWTLLNPLAQLTVLAFIFGFLLPLRIPNYTSFLLTGLLSWSWFQSSLLQATSVIVDNRELIKRPGFPAAVLPTVTVTSHFVHFLLALPILLLVLRWDGRPATAALLGLPFVIGLQFVLTLGLALLVSSMHVAFRDTRYLLEIALQLLFFLTPVFYDSDVIPTRYEPLYRLNPMVHALTAYRAILIQGDLPARSTLLILATVGAVLLCVGHLTFRRASRHFVWEL
jgi:lipopolysaccharide transport system permease protein